MSEEMSRANLLGWMRRFGGGLRPLQEAASLIEHLEADLTRVTAERDELRIAIANSTADRTEAIQRAEKAEAERDKALDELQTWSEEAESLAATVDRQIALKNAAEARIAELERLLGEAPAVSFSGLRCRFGCDAPVAGVYHAPEGCHCWRDPVQALCAQHALTIESTGPVTAIVQDPGFPDKGRFAAIVAKAEGGGRVQG